MSEYTVLPDDQTIITEMEHNLRDKLKYVASKLSDMRIDSIAGVSVVDSALPSDTFNTAFGPPQTEKVAASIFARYKHSGQPMAWWIGPSAASEDTNILLSNAGFAYVDLDIGMACELQHVPTAYRAVDKLAIRRCTTQRDYSDFGHVLASIFDPPDAQVILFYEKLATIHADEIKEMLLFVGYEGSSPVATACLFLTNVAGIYDVATRPDKRRQGYGSAMFYHSLIQAKAMGLHHAVLQASPEGLNIYKRFGFRELCTFNVWSNQQ